METKFIYTGIRVKNMDESINFYTKILNMKLLKRYRIEKNKGEVAYLCTDDCNFYLELNYYDKESPFYTEYILGEALDHLAFKVKNLDETIKELRNKGISILTEIKVENERWIYIQDPNGIWIELYE